MRRTISAMLMIVALALSQSPTSRAALLYENYVPEFVFGSPPAMIATEFTVGAQPVTVTKLGVRSRGGGFDLLSGIASLTPGSYELPWWRA